VKELCTRYLDDLQAGLILGKGGRLKKPTTITTDTCRIERHIIPLIRTRRVKDLTKADINKVLKDIMAGKTRVSIKTKKLRGKAVELRDLRHEALPYLFLGAPRPARRIYLSVRPAQTNAPHDNSESSPETHQK